jgi:indole-3-glycerol phosphate synthase
MNILSEIIENKKIEVEEKKSLYPVKLLEKSIYFNTNPVSLKKYLLRRDKNGIIAEFKTKSPSKGAINPYANIEKISIEYMQAGASALSVLTDEKYFGGNTKNLTKARKYNYCPILQKDFFIDEYQIVEAKSIGADAILLIASALPKAKLESMAKLAKSLGLEVLFEVHNENELDLINEHIEIVGVNNRNLETFETDINQSIKLSSIIPNNLVKVSESGIHEVCDIIKLKSYGYNGFLIGENFMKTANPGKTCKEFIKRIKKAEKNLTTKINEYAT